MITFSELCKLIDLQPEVINKVSEINCLYNHSELSHIWKKLYSPDSWNEGTTQLQSHFAEDTDNMKILTCLLNCAIYTYELYTNKGIPQQIFIDTMKFIPRFIERHKQAYGTYNFVWGWWLPRQLSLNEFRIGALEYELKNENGACYINIHIPSDACLKKDILNRSHSGLKDFLNRFYPSYKDAELYCNSWLLSPELKALLKDNSNILYFQNCFDIIDFDSDSNSFLEWLYFRRDLPYDKLPENTSLQIAVKERLLKGGRIGTARGKLKGFA